MMNDSPTTALATTNRKLLATELTVMLACSAVVLYPLLFFISYYYGDYIHFLFDTTGAKPALIENHTAQLLFKAAKALCTVVFAFMLYTWFDWFNGRKLRTTRFINNIAKGVYTSLSANRQFFLSLHKNTRIALILFFGIQFFSCLYFLCTVPLHYDEWLSFRYFSSKGIWTSLSFYPVPNNHVFYNIVSSLFLKLPLDAEISMRLPSLLASLITSWYFFKICRRYFNDGVSVLLMACLLTLHPIIVYSFQARGYSFVNLFCVLLIYASIPLSEQYTSRKYRSLFILSSFLGMWSVPSFLYVLVPVYTLLGIYILKQRATASLLRYIKDVALGMLLVVAGYIFIYKLNSPENLTNPNGGATKFSLHEPDAWLRITGHLKEVAAYLFYSPKLLYILSILIFASLAYSLLKKKTNYLYILSAFMFFSPLLLLAIHRVIPFQRTWLYLAYPAAICMGMIIDSGMHLLRSVFPIVQRTSLQVFVFTGVLALTLLLLPRFPNEHLYYSRFDYEINTVRKTWLEGRYANIRQIALTKNGAEYYPAEVIWNMCYKYNPLQDVHMATLDSIHGQDLLIIDNSRLPEFENNLENYRVLYQFDEGISIYGNKQIMP